MESIIQERVQEVIVEKEDAVKLAEATQNMLSQVSEGQEKTKEEINKY